MSFTLPRFKAGFAAATALTVAALGMGAATAPANAAGGAFYTAELAQPTDETRLVAGGVAWSCKGSTCVAGKGSSRPLRMCRKLQRDVGEITAFTANGEALTAERLAACNK